ncbi:alpha-amylase family glycosyl hydrolase, partial [Abiotrophia sp. HMSC24B09]|uniref:alpha-amylase family glycosyl hydrolase n=1 Tax=Abiotrophia sp. HMSC24B09 TaxID=1581061 RepID=UPI0025C050B2
MVESKWWQNRVAYQIYPKSFKDSNGDGVGDIRGIIEKLDYLQSLGIGIIWISPIYQSPFVDQGYDISDYYAIDPIFGTMEDFDELIAQADKRDIKIVMDLVVNHCSDQHPWFQAALKDLSSHYADYFYFVESPDGPPNNWRSYFGGSVWEKLPDTNTYYLHSFHKTQPDLNWQNPRLRQEIYQMVNWWLEKGIAGFRIDAIINIKKNLTWQSYPADRPDGLVAVQRSLQDAQPIEPFLNELKAECFEPHQAFTVGEVFDASESELHEFMGDQGYFSSIFDFSQTELGKSPLGWYDHQPVTAEMIKEAIFQTQAKTQEAGYWSTIIENHDEPRGVNFYLQGQEI